ncbi:GMC family oxidoreductase N-terminal domain-containing protein [Nonomuraea sp. NPDC049758]|uniref:GMC family oxidoreductase n=1 Tax=Nonomuraea sp. NPDC049758 TaxID=3154360 RepID=UPI0034329DA0
MTQSFDFVVVGGGTAGSVIAARLSELPGASVLVLEAGDTKVTDAVEDPSRWNEVLLTELDWAYMSEPQPGLGGRQVYSAAGRGLGGTSNVYHMIHTRGRPADFDAWAYDGCPGWSYADVLPYFRRLEGQRDATNPTAGHDGPIKIVNARDMGNPVSQTFVDACVELGYPQVEDFNADSFGVSWHHVDIDMDIDADKGTRCGVRASYLEPALERLSVEVGALATRLLFEGERCVGVEYLKDGELRTVRAEHEVIVSAGAIQSPKLLQLSGIGEAGALAALGIPVVADLPGVGANFHDHPLVIGPIGYMEEAAPDPRGQVTEVGLFWGSEPGLPVPDMEICLVHRAPFGDQFFANVIKRVETGQPLTPVRELVDPKIVLTLPGLVRPLSRGSVRLAGTDPTAYPRVSANYFAERSDLERTVTMVQIARDIYASSAFRRDWGLTEVAPGPDVRTREQLSAWVVENVGSYYHFAGSCKMGSDSLAVVDTRLRVRGVEGLRVADASIMPTIVSANPHTTTVMIGERAAEFVAADFLPARQEATR